MFVCSSASSQVIYINASTQGGTVYATAAIDWPGGGWPSYAQHTYDVSVSIVSPSGRTSGGSAYGGAPASEVYDTSASTALEGSIDDLGTFSVEATYDAYCSVGGHFINGVKQFLNGLFAISSLNYILEDAGLFCQYMVWCPNGIPTGNVCSKQYPTIEVEPDSHYGCLNYFWDDTLVVTIFGVSECTISGGTMSTTARNCS